MCKCNIGSLTTLPLMEEDSSSNNNNNKGNSHLLMEVNKGSKAKGIMARWVLLLREE